MPVQQHPIGAQLGTSGGFTLWRYNVDTYNDLLAISGQNIDDVAKVKNSQGTNWLPGSLGGTYYPSGFYTWDGAEWNMDDTIEQIADELQTLVDNMVIVLNDVDDVDTVTNPPVAGESLLIWDGTNWVPFEPFYDTIKATLSRPGQTTIGLINQTSTLEEYLRLTFTPRDTDNYKISGSFEYSLNATNEDFIGVVEIRRASDDLLIGNIRNLNSEQQDSGGAGIVLNTISGGVIGGNTNTGTDQMFECSFDEDFILTAGVEYYARIQWAQSDVNDEAAIYKAQISAEQKTITA